MSPGNPSEGVASKSSRVVMLGLDGAAWTWLRSPLVAETMPNLRGFLEGASSGTLMSTVPCYTGPAWTTITTGLDPGRHGVFGFTDRTGRPNSNRHVTAPRVWDFVGQAGGRSLVVNVPLTFPAKEIEGVMVAGMPVPPQVPLATPVEMNAELDSLAGGRYVADVPLLGSPSVKRTCASLIEMTEGRRQLIDALLRRGDWDLVAVVFVLPDRLGHSWWKYLVPGDPHYDTAEAAETRGHVGGTLRSLDRAIGELLAAQPSGTTTVLCSDHGFGALDADVFFDVELVKAGLIEAGTSSKVGRQLARLGRAGATRLMPRSMVEKVKNRVNVHGERRAWTAPIYEQSVCLSDPADADLRERVTQMLTDLRSPDGGEVVTTIRSRDKIFRGDQVARAPDLFPRMVSETVQLHDGLHASESWVSRADLPWGTHASEGVIAMDLAAASGVKGNAVDVTPTLLALLGLEAPGLDGRTLVDRSVEQLPELGAVDEGVGLTTDEEEAVMEHLKGLGYVE